MSLKDLIFQKGGIGVSMSREETIAQLNPIIEQHMALNHRHQAVIAALTDRAAADALAALQRVARMDVGKLMESVFSAGGVAFNGVGQEPDAYAFAGDDTEQLYQLLEAEQALAKAVTESLTLDHQIRTKAILSVVQTNSQERINQLKAMTLRRRRTQPSS